MKIFDGAWKLGRVARRREVAWGSIGVVAALAGVLALNAVGVLGSEADAPSTTASANDAGQVLTDSGRGGVPGVLVEPGTPCMNAAHVPVEILKAGEVVEQFSTPAVLPDPDVASPTDAWTCGLGPIAPVVMFDNVQVTYDPTWKGVDPTTKWKETQKLREGGEVIEIAGLPAYTLDGTEEDPISTLLVIQNDVLIQMYGVELLDAARMVPLAESILKNSV